MFAAEEQANITFAFFSLIAYVFAQKAVKRAKIAIINVSSKLELKGKTNKRHRIPNKASFGIVERKANTEVSVPLKTSIIQFANGKIASFANNPKTIIVAENVYNKDVSLSTIFSYISVIFRLEVNPYKYETPNKNTPVETALVIRYLNEASFEKYPLDDAIKKYVGKLNNSIDINRVKKSFALTVDIAPNTAVRSNA
jgi:hypothetical protein